MSIQLYTQEQIVNHVENASPTKFMYSFSRAERFPPINRTGKSDRFYTLPSMRMNRTTGFGYGHKSDFTKNKSCSTEFVSIKRDFDKGNQRGLKYSFGLGRDSFTKAYCPGYKNLDKNVPGPAKYNIIKPLGDDAPKYSLHAICGERGWINKNMDNPAPGTYQPIIKINSQGRYPLSTISNIKASNFGLSRSDRWSQYKNNKVPAPNAYKTKDLMGINFNSKFRSGKLISMSQKFRYKDSRESYPGPGAYLRFSEFGILVSKNARKRNEETKNSANTKISKTEANEDVKETNANVETTKNETKQLETE